METSPCHNSVAGHQIATNFCTCHDSTAVVPCTKFCSDHGNHGVEVRVKRNFHRIWIAMEKTFSETGPRASIEIKFQHQSQPFTDPADVSHQWQWAWLPWRSSSSASSDWCRPTSLAWWQWGRSDPQRPCQGSRHPSVLPLCHKHNNTINSLISDAPNPKT